MVKFTRVCQPMILSNIKRIIYVSFGVMSFLLSKSRGDVSKIEIFSPLVSVENTGVDTVKAVLFLWNPTERPINIRSIELGCSCVSLKNDSLIVSPSSGAYIPIEISSKDKPGIHSTYAIFLGSNGKKKIARIEWWVESNSGLVLSKDMVSIKADHANLIPQAFSVFGKNETIKQLRVSEIPSHLALKEIKRAEVAKNITRVDFSLLFRKTENNVFTPKSKVYFLGSKDIKQDIEVITDEYVTRSVFPTSVNFGVIKSGDRFEKTFNFPIGNISEVSVTGCFRLESKTSFSGKKKASLALIASFEKKNVGEVIEGQIDFKNTEGVSSKIRVFAIVSE